MDGTLSVQSNIPAGELRVRYRMEYLRADLRRTGVRANSIRMLRRDVPGARWVRATNSIRRQTPIRYLRDERADFVLGHHGYLREKRYVWAVMDVNSEYAIGGAVPVGVPLLIPILLIATGAGIGLLGLKSLRRAR